jgi:hypothetical protein
MNLPDFEYKEMRFLNVDLDLVSRSDLQPLVTALEPGAFALHVGHEKRTYSAHLELSKFPKSPDAAIRGFAALIQHLSRAERKLWDTAKVRDLNIGVQSAMQPRTFEINLTPDTLEIASILRARIVFTVYAPS